MKGGGLLGDRREVVGLLLAVLLSILVSIAFTWPLVKHLDRVVVGGGELGGWLWRYDWHFRSLDALLAEGLSPWNFWRAFVSLGRYPETGNILDVLVFSYPLDRLIGFPASYNIKVLLVLVLNGVSAYAMARYFSGSISAALGASAIAIVNPLCQLEVQACGLRQAILWWVLLFPPLLDRALRRRTVSTGAIAGICWGMAAAFYWFYGLFTLLFGGIWLLKHFLVERARLDFRGTTRAVAGVGLGVALFAGPFVLPYLAPADGGRAGGASQLPEMTFFLPYPAYDTIMNAPLRPSNYAENVLASIHRAIGSSWSLTYPLDPTLNEALPLTVALVGILPAVFRRRSWGWLLAWLVFYLGTLGPFLRIGAGDNQKVLMVFEEYVVRLPYTLMFQFIPGMSRMFAPYRLAAFVVVCSVALVAMGLARLPLRPLFALLLVGLTLAQPMARLGRGAVNEGDADSRELRSPFKMNQIRVPQFYKDLDPTLGGGIVELPLDQQQDLTCYYQVIHQQKVYRSWATPGGIPPEVRRQGTGGFAGQRLRFQARPDVITGPVPDALDLLSKTPDTAAVSGLTLDAVKDWARAGSYHLIIVHERGYFLVDPARGAILYTTAVTRLATALNLPIREFEELRKGDPARPEFGVPMVGDLVPWSSQPADLPVERAPAVYRMTVFEIPDVLSDGEVPDIDGLQTAPATPPPETGGPEHVEAAPGAPRPAASP